MKRQILTGAALLALVAGQVAAQTPPDQPRQRPEHGGGGGPRSGGGERPQGNGGGPRFDGGQRPDFNRGGGGGWQGRGGGAPQAAAPAAPTAPAQAAQPNFGGDRGGGGYRRFGGGENGGFRGQRFGGAQAAPAMPNPTVQAPQQAPAFQGQRYGQRFGGQDQNRGQYGQGFRDRQGLPPDGQRLNDQRAVGGDPRANGWRPDGGGRSNGQRYGGQGFTGQGFSGQRFGGDGQRFGDRGGYRGGGARSFSYRGRSYGAFRAQPYRYPRGYGYRRYAVRSYLPLALISSSWFLNDWSSYYLSPPPSQQYHWVRYGPDALLIDTYTGQVVDAAYGVFDDGESGGYDEYRDYPDDAYGGGYPPPSYPGPY